MTSAPPTTAPAVLLALYAETPLHPGSGQSTGIIDLPIQREKHTRFPLIPATSLKGSLRERAERELDAAAVQALFGAESNASELHAGALGFADARLLAFPVRALAHVFVWVTCPLVLGRLARDLAAAGHAAAPQAPAPAEGQMLVPPGEWPAETALEDLALAVGQDPAAATLAGWLAAQFLPEGAAHAAYRDKLAHHLAVIRDEDFGWLVEHATQVTARIALNERKTTTGDGGNLWYEETLPADTLLYTVIRAEPPRWSAAPFADAAQVRAGLQRVLAGGYLQIGGNETVGQGWLAARIAGEGGNG